jgi:hypothetical protein
MRYLKLLQHPARAPRGGRRMLQANHGLLPDQ